MSAVLQKSCFDFNVNGSVCLFLRVCVAPSPSPSPPPAIALRPRPVFPWIHPARYNCHPAADHGDSQWVGFCIKQEAKDSIVHWGSQHRQSVQAGPPPVTLVRQFWSNAEIIIMKKTLTQPAKYKEKFALSWRKKIYKAGGLVGRQLGAFGAVACAS